MPHTYRHVTEPGHDGSRGKDELRKEDLALYDLETDRGETKNVAGEHPDVVARLQQFVEQARQDLGDGKAQRCERPAARRDRTLRACGQNRLGEGDSPDLLEAVANLGQSLPVLSPGPERAVLPTPHGQRRHGPRRLRAIAAARPPVFEPPLRSAPSV